ncbi:MAG TPA: glycosyltransferase family 4 protein [Hyphomicrobiaceae bacterium]|nr:glycosyltransferase family 4 protein [Hyphomicrobiaceae bacterium]
MGAVPRSSDDQWIVCQLGARENYMIARTLAASENLAALITDVWEKPGSIASRLSPRLGERYHPDLEAARVEAPGYAHLVRELRGKYLGGGGWRRIMERNAWFEEMAVGRLRALIGEGVPCGTVFSYSYAAGAIFRAARSSGLRTVLGQIDPGPVEDQLVASLYERAGQSSRYERIPERYWHRWREEIALSDVIVVNSDWSKRALVSLGVSASKVTIVPLAYDRPRSEAGVRRELPSEFTHDRLLRLLFLGQVTFRKGIGPVLEAMQRMPDAPMRLDIVGEVQIDLPAWTIADTRIVLHGAVPRSAVSSHYRDADLFLFPTHSDGFGLTQLEALAHGLPVLASRNCGEVIEHGVNGFVLDRLTPDAIEDVLGEILDRPSRLQAWADQARVPSGFTMAALAENLKRLPESR